MTRIREGSPEETTEQQKSLFLNFAHRLLGKIDDWSSEESVATRTSSRVEFTNGGWQTHTDHWKDYHYLISSRREVIREWPEAEKCTRSHLAGGVLKIGDISDSAGKPIIAPTFDQVYPFLFEEMIRPVVDTLQSHSRHDVTDEQLLDKYCDWRSFQLRSSDVYMMIAPLQRLFTSEIDSIKVTEDIEFCALTPSLKSHLVSDPAPSLGPRPMDISMLNYCLIAKYDQSRDHPRMASGSPDLRKDITHFMSALRLLKTGSIDYAALFTLSEDNPRGGIGISYENWEGWGSEYCLEEDDVTGLLTLFKNLRSGSQERWIQPLEIGLRKFEDSYGRRKAEDRLIDLTIALESTLLAGTDDELKYRLSLRGATLLRMTIDPIWTKAVLEAVYDSRSDIVHNGKSLADIKMPKKLLTSTKLKTLHQLIDACELITRSVLCEYLKELKTGKSIMAISSHLDQLIIDGITAGTQFDEIKQNSTHVDDSD